jgi:hypothetical protein
LYGIPRRIREEERGYAPLSDSLPREEESNRAFPASISPQDCRGEAFDRRRRENMAKVGREGDPPHQILKEKLVVAKK